jgi:murein DD-endopeptidase MepM/ murein hydrolase activator NlpD
MNNVNIINLAPFAVQSLAMKRLALAASLTLLFLSSSQSALSAPKPPLQLVESGGWDFAPPGDVAGEHDDVEAAQWAEAQGNIERLRAEGKLAAPDTTQAAAFAWPMRPANGLADYGYHGVSAFVDHDPVIGQLLDYEGGDRTYDSGTYNHRGTDYFLWPFSWNKVDNGEVEVIAAASGVIVTKWHDQPNDHSCSSNNTGFGNSIYLQHADGSMSIYAHMRYGSLTAKGVGDSVALGEYLGTVASSGNSTGPHLHFEVRPSVTTTEIIDPYTGSYNPIPSSWQSQPPYYDSAINKIAAADAYPDFPTACGQHTDPHLQDDFTAPGDVQFHVYYRDYRGALPTLFYIYQPDDAIYYTWSFTETTTFVPAAFRYWIYEFPADAPTGTWRLEALYNGQTYATYFNINAPVTLTLTSPNGGENLMVNYPHTIQWNDNLGGSMTLQLFQNGNYVSTLANATPSDGSYTWWPTAPVGPGYTIRVIDAANPNLYDESNAGFNLVPLNLPYKAYLPSVHR